MKKTHTVCPNFLLKPACVEQQRATKAWAQLLWAVLWSQLAASWKQLMLTTATARINVQPQLLSLVLRRTRPKKKWEKPSAWKLSRPGRAKGLGMRVPRVSKHVLCHSADMDVKVHPLKHSLQGSQSCDRFISRLFIYYIYLCWQSAVRQVHPDKQPEANKKYLGALQIITGWVGGQVVSCLKWGVKSKSYFHVVRVEMFRRSEVFSVWKRNSSRVVHCTTSCFLVGSRMYHVFLGRLRRSAAGGPMRKWRGWTKPTPCCVSHAVWEAARSLLSPPA